jgi:hypothetical protein
MLQADLIIKIAIAPGQTYTDPIELISYHKLGPVIP